MSSSSAATAEKFQPAWIRAAFHGPGNGGSVTSSPRVSTTEEEPPIEPCAAILAKNRYGREEVLVLQPKPITVPKGLERCPIFVPEARGPVVMTPISELEQRLQMNINSSKAMSSLNQNERMAVATGGSPNGPNSPQIKPNQWTPGKAPSNWARGASALGGGISMNGRANLSRSLGRGAPLGQSEEQASPYGQKYVPRGRGGAMAGRGASTTAGAAQINSRAQGLYDPKDPKDRPRNRVRSTSDDADPSEDGWSMPVNRFGRQNSSSAWNKDENSWNQSVERENSFSATQKQDNGGGMPEWFDDEDEAEKPTESAGGSFDDDGRYRQLKENQASASRWRASQQGDAHNHQERLPHSAPQAVVTNISNGPKQAEVPEPPRTTEFFYLDPTDVERGPFNKEQMFTWYSMNYFSDTLKVRRKEDPQYKTLGELKVLNGPATVFDYKSSPPPAPVAAPVVTVASTNQAFGYPSNAGFSNSLFGGGGVWNEMFPTPVFTPNVASAFDDKNMTAEKQRYDLQKQMEMMQQAKLQAEEQTRAAKEKELEFQRKQEAMRKQYEEEILRKQMEQVEMKRKLEALEAEKIARLEEERRRQEEEQKKREAKKQKEDEQRLLELRKIEEERRLADEEAKRRELILNRKQEEEDRRRRAEEAAEEHRKMLQKKAEEDAAKIRQMQAAAAAARREEEDRKAARDVEKMFNSDDVWNTSKPSTPATDVDSPWQTAVPKKFSASDKPKAAPWSTSAQAASREKTLREIQEEEERQQVAEAKEMARLRKEQENSGVAPSIQSGTWANASQRISWNSGSVSKATGKPAWGGAGVDSKPVVSAANWDGPSLQAANKIPAPVQAAKKVKEVPPVPKQTPVKPANKVPSVDPFTQWVTKRLKEINSDVDADVLSSFLESVENPNEVEDYIEGYLGSSKSTKEFVKEYLQKRSEARKRRDTDKDDLSSASQAGSGTGGTQGKKKKGKGTRLIVDSSCLGFRATSDPNRVNQGEIETAFLTPQKR